MPPLRFPTVAAHQDAIHTTEDQRANYPGHEPDKEARLGLYGVLEHKVKHNMGHYSAHQHDKTHTQTHGEVRMLSEPSEEGSHVSIVAHGNLQVNKEPKPE